jgi:hypothetical protein
LVYLEQIPKSPALYYISVIVSPGLKKGIEKGMISFEKLQKRGRRRNVGRKRFCAVRKP